MIGTEIVPIDGSLGEVIAPDDQSIRVVACPSPFRMHSIQRRYPAGVTLAEIVEDVQPNPALRRCAHVFIGDMLVNRDLLHRVRPKPGTLVNVRMAPQGGNGGKILRLVITLAAIALSVAFPYLGPAFASFAASFPTLTGIIQAAIPVAVPLMARPLIGSTQAPRRLSCHS